LNTSKNSKNTDPAAQHARFVETARELGCDESEEAFDEKLKAIAKPNPNPNPNPKPKDKLATRPRWLIQQSGR